MEMGEEGGGEEIGSGYMGRGSKGDGMGRRSLVFDLERESG